MSSDGSFGAGRVGRGERSTPREPDVANDEQRTESSGVSAAHWRSYGMDPQMTRVGGIVLPAGYLEQSGGSSSAPAGDAPVQRKAASGGEPLAPAVRSTMESRLGHDFSQVRVHEGREAAAEGAVAYAKGSDVHFSPGAYQPDTPIGAHLLGHELAHVAQQQRSGPAASSSVLEAQAERAGSAAAGGHSAPAIGASAPGIQRFDRKELAALEAKYGVSLRGNKEHKKRLERLAKAIQAFNYADDHYDATKLEDVRTATNKLIAALGTSAPETTATLRERFLAPLERLAKAATKTDRPHVVTPGVPALGPKLDAFEAQKKKPTKLVVGEPKKDAKDGRLKIKGEVTGIEYSVNPESLDFFDQGRPGQGFAVLVDLRAGEIYLAPSINWKYDFQRMKEKAQAEGKWTREDDDPYSDWQNKLIKLYGKDPDCWVSPDRKEMTTKGANPDYKGPTKEWPAKFTPDDAKKWKFEKKLPDPEGWFRRGKDGAPPVPMPFSDLMAEPLGQNSGGAHAIVLNTFGLAKQKQDNVLAGLGVWKGKSHTFHEFRNRSNTANATSFQYPDEEVVGMYRRRSVPDSLTEEIEQVLRALIEADQHARHPRFIRFFEPSGTNVRSVHRERDKASEDRSVRLGGAVREEQRRAEFPVTGAAFEAISIIKQEVQKLAKNPDPALGLAASDLLVALKQARVEIAQAPKDPSSVKAVKLLMDGFCEAHADPKFQPLVDLARQIAGISAAVKARLNPPSALSSASAAPSGSLPPPPPPSSLERLHAEIQKRIGQRRAAVANLKPEAAVVFNRITAILEELAAAPVEDSPLGLRAALERQYGLLAGVRESVAGGIGATLAAYDDAERERVRGRIETMWDDFAVLLGTWCDAAAKDESPALGAGGEIELIAVRGPRPTPASIEGHAVCDVAGDGMDCLIRALLLASGYGPNEDMVTKLRQHLIREHVAFENDMLELTGLEGAVLISEMQRLGVISALRGIRVYRYNDHGAIVSDLVVAGGNPIRLWFSPGHFQAIMR
jgi:hypothetical protein